MSSYHPELYDDCRDAFSGFSVSLIRRVLGEATENRESLDLAQMSDDDVRRLIRITCLGLAMGLSDSWADLALTQTD